MTAAAIPYTMASTAYKKPFLHNKPTGLEYGMLYLDYPEKPISRRGIHRDKIRGAYITAIANIFETPNVIDMIEELKAFDRHTYEHARRVFTHTIDSGFHFDLHKKYGIEGIIDLGIAAIGHDNGKMLIGKGSKERAYEIINDTRSPLPEEYVTMIRAHPKLSYALIEPISVRAAQIALRHHEWNKFDPYPFDGNSMKYQGKPMPVDDRPAEPGVAELSQHLAANDMRDGRCSFFDDRSNRVYQLNDAMSPHDKADWLMRAFAGRPVIMARAVHSLTMGVD